MTNTTKAPCYDITIQKEAPHYKHGDIFVAAATIVSVAYTAFVTLSALL